MQCSALSSTRSSSGPRDLARFAWLAAASASLIGCGPRLVLAPDSPMLITEGTGRVRVAVLDPTTRLTIDYGWIDARELVGQTVVTYEWNDAR